MKNWLILLIVPSLLFSGCGNPRSNPARGQSSLFPAGSTEYETINYQIYELLSTTSGLTLEVPDLTFEASASVILSDYGYRENFDRSSFPEGASTLVALGRLEFSTTSNFKKEIITRFPLTISVMEGDKFRLYAFDVLDFKWKEAHLLLKSIAPINAVVNSTGKEATALLPTIDLLPFSYVFGLFSEKRG